MQRTNIEWAKNQDGTKGHVWNPVRGCLRGCSYCYARKFARRFFNDKDFKPKWIQDNFEKSMPNKPSVIFVNSMSDPEWWDPEWMHKVFNKIRDNFKHTFIFLTKNPEIYKKHIFPLNSRLGITVTNREDILKVEKFIERNELNSHFQFFLSMEPILEKLEQPGQEFLDFFSWLIVGAETGNRKGRVTPERKWIYNLMDWGIPIFMKNNLASIWSKKLIQEIPNNGSI